MSVADLSRLDDMLESMRIAARIPGLAIAVVVGDETKYARGFGHCDLKATMPVTAETIYPIASTAKAFNATLLGMLADDRALAWDRPVQDYLPHFRLQDDFASSIVTIRDLLAMRTGLPLHEWVWVENPISRAELVERLRHLPLSAGVRERFQYSDLTPTVAGHVAETIAGESWEDLIRSRMLEPLGMLDTGFLVPATNHATLAYHESLDRSLLCTERKTADLIAPAGGSIHSTVNDMARWIAFNLNEGQAGDQRLISRETLRDVQSPCVLMGADPTAPSKLAGYAFGWCVDTYNGCTRISHTGHLYNVNSCVSLHPAERVGIVSFVNFASCRPAQLINEHAFDVVMGFQSRNSLAQKLAAYEQSISNTQRRNASVRRVADAKPSHPLSDYEGLFEHAGYGKIRIGCSNQMLALERNEMILPLEHWHYDAWVGAQTDCFEIHKAHAFDRASRLVFRTDQDGAIDTFIIQLEPAVEPIQFRRR
jgi:CubicO group peptidase (beta-lactamase class C family)